MGDVLGFLAVAVGCMVAFAILISAAASDGQGIVSVTAVMMLAACLLLAMLGGCMPQPQAGPEVDAVQVSQPIPPPPPPAITLIAPPSPQADPGTFPAWVVPRTQPDGTKTSGSWLLLPETPPPPQTMEPSRTIPRAPRVPTPPRIPIVPNERKPAPPDGQALPPLAPPASASTPGGPGQDLQAIPGLHP